MNILIIDEDPSLHDLIKQSSIASFCNIYFPNDYEDYEELFIFIKDNNIHVIIADLDRNKKERLSLLKKTKKFDPLLDMIMVGKSLAPEEVVDLINQGASDYLARPLQLDSIQKTLKNIINKKALRRKTFLLEKSLEKKYSFQGIIGKSPYMLEIFSLIEKISKYFTSVLVIGETGTGKEMVARAIHNLSQVNNKNLVICDCVSIPENLFESELFGYAKGAFTGAYKDKKGLFEEAHNGIIFLDEIGEIPLSIQAKLLRVLEHHQFRPLGSNKIRNVEIRAIAATSRDLRKDIESGTFRKDLFHRLNKIEIHLPPLRKRPEDIPLLVRHFLNRYSKKLSKKIEGVSQEAQKIFLRYEWPGNVRELENVLERASILSKKEFIDIKDLPKYLQEHLPSKSKIPFINKKNLSTLNDLEKEYIIYLLKTTGNNLRKTAQILDISRTTLYNKIRKYNISH